MGAENSQGMDAFFRNQSLIERGFVPEGQHPLEFAPYTDIWNTLQFPNYPDMPSYRLSLLHHVILADVNFGLLIEKGGNVLDYIRKIDMSLRGYDPNLGQSDWTSFTAVPGLNKLIWNNIGLSASCCLNLPGHPSTGLPGIIKHCFNFDLYEMMGERDNKDPILRLRRNAVTLTLGSLVATWFANHKEAYEYAKDAVSIYRDKIRFFYSKEGILMHRTGSVRNYRTLEGHQHHIAEQHNRAHNSGDERGLYTKGLPRRRSRRGSAYWRSLEAANLIDY